MPTDEVLVPISAIESFAVLRAQLTNISTLEQGWNGSDAEPPNEQSLATAATILDRIEARQQGLARVAASNHGGVCLAWVSASKSGILEVLNGGDLTATTSDGNTWTVSDIDQALDTLTSFVGVA